MSPELVAEINRLNTQNAEFIKGIPPTYGDWTRIGPKYSVMFVWKSAAMDCHWSPYRPPSRKAMVKVLPRYCKARDAFMLALAQNAGGVLGMLGPVAFSAEDHVITYFPDGRVQVMEFPV